MKAFENMGGFKVAMREARVESGILSGVAGGNPGITVYKGIPYAAPPVGDLRWREPQPEKPWTGIRNAHTFRNICSQNAEGPGTFYHKEFFYYPESMSEDCLYLNVWTPAATAEEKLPVLFWIHGGGFARGYGSAVAFDGEGFAKKGIITVTINYRLGAFGFFAHPELSSESGNKVSGNYGILDQIAALKWVRRNIAAFGGDPDNITIAGQSAGAGSVHALVSSPLTRGDIKRAIMQSGGGIYAISTRPYMALKQAEEANDLMSVLGVSSIAEARKMSDREILEKTSGINAKGRARFFPVVDGYVLPEDPSIAALNDHQHGIQYMVGSTSDEGLLPQKLTLEQFKKDEAPIYGLHADEYFKLCCLEGEEKFQEYQNIRMGENMRVANVAWCELQEEQNRLPSYLYWFDKKLPGDNSGAFHSAEHWYVFQTLLRSWRPFTGKDFDLSMVMSGYWANFIRTGNPNGEGLPEWTPYTKASPLSMELGENAGMIEIKENPRETFRKNFLLGRL